MHTVFDWLKAGSPAHWYYVAGTAFLILWYTVRKSKLKADNPIEMIFDVLDPVLIPIFSRVPWLGIAFKGLQGAPVIPDPAPKPPEAK